MNKKTNKGFTLVEMVVAVAIFSIVVGIIGTIFSKAFVTYKTMNDLIKYEDTANTIMAQLRMELANASDVELLPLSANYDSYMTYDSLFKDDDGNLISDFKRNSDVTYKFIICDSKAGLRIVTVTGSDDGSIITSETRQYEKNSIMGVQPIIKFMKTSSTTGSILIDIHLYKTDSTYVDDGTATFKEADGSDRAYYYGLTSQMSFHNSQTVTSASGDTVYLRAIKFKVPK